MNTINLQFGDYAAAAYQALKQHEKYKRAKADADRGKNLAGFVGRYIDIDHLKHRQAIYPLIIQAQNIRLLWPEANKQTKSDFYSSKKIKGQGIKKLQELFKNPEYKQELQNYIDQNAKIGVLQVVYSRDPDNFERVFTDKDKTLMERFNRAGRFSELMTCARHGLPQATGNRPYLTAAVNLQKEIKKVSLWECIRSFSFRKTVYLRKLREQFHKNASSINRHELEVIAANKDYCKRFCDKTLTEANLQNHIYNLKQAELAAQQAAAPIAQAGAPIERLETLFADTASIPMSPRTQPQVAPEVKLPAISGFNTCTDITVHNNPQPRYTLISPILDATDTELSSFSRIMKTLINDYQHDAMDQSQKAVGPVWVRINSTDEPETLKRNYNPRLICDVDNSDAYHEDKKVLDEIEARWEGFETEMKENQGHITVRNGITLLAKISRDLAKHYTIKCTELETLEKIFKEIKTNFTSLLFNFRYTQDDLVINDIEYLTYDEAHRMCHAAAADIVKIIPQLCAASENERPKLLEKVKNKLSRIFTFIAWADVNFYKGTPDKYHKYVNVTEVRYDTKSDTEEKVTELSFEEKVTELSFEENVTELSFEEKVTELSFDTELDTADVGTKSPKNMVESPLGYELYAGHTLFGQQKVKNEPASRCITENAPAAG